MVKPTDNPKYVIIVCPCCKEHYSGDTVEPWPHTWKCYRCGFLLLMQLEFKDYPDIIFSNG